MSTINPILECTGSCISKILKSSNSEAMDEFFQVMQNCQNEEKIFEEIKFSYLSEIKEIIALLMDKADKLMLSLEEMFLNRQKSQTSFLYLCLMIGKSATCLPELIKTNCFTKEKLSDSKGIKSALKLVSNLDKLKQSVSELSISLKCDHCEKAAIKNEAFLMSTETCMCSQPSSDFQNKIHCAFLEALSKEGGCDFPLYMNYLRRVTEFYTRKNSMSASPSEVESVHSFEVIPEEDLQELTICDCLCRSSEEIMNNYEVCDCDDLSIVNSDDSGHVKDGCNKLSEDNMSKTNSFVFNPDKHSEDNVYETKSFLFSPAINDNDTDEMSDCTYYIKDRVSNFPANKGHTANEVFTPADIVKQSFSHYFNQPPYLLSPRTLERPAIKEPKISSVALKISESAEKLRVNLTSNKQNSDILNENKNQENVKDLLKVALNSYYFGKNDKNIWLKA